METIGDWIAKMDPKFRWYKVFKRLDHDNDGFITLWDLENAARHLKLDVNASDLHWLLTEIDGVKDTGSIDVGQFTRGFVTAEGNFLDKLQKPIARVYYEGGVLYSGPLAAREQSHDMQKDDGEDVGVIKTDKHIEQGTTLLEEKTPEIWD